MFRFSSAALSGLLVFVPPQAWADELAPVALNSLSAAPAGMASAKVLDQHGQVLGQVERVQTDQNGKPSALSFRAASNGQIVVISAAAASYDGKVVVASNDQPQIAALTRSPRTD